MHIKWKSFIPLAGAVIGFIISPEFLAIVPDTTAHIIIAGSTILQALAPQIFVKKT